MRASVLITHESRGNYYVSLRSHGNVPVERVAKVFGGGGHKNAAGFTITGKYKKVAKRIVAEIEKFLEE